MEDRNAAHGISFREYREGRTLTPGQRGSAGPRPAGNPNTSLNIGENCGRLKPAGRFFPGRSDGSRSGRRTIVTRHAEGSGTRYRDRRPPEVALFIRGEKGIVAYFSGKVIRNVVPPFFTISSVPRSCFTSMCTSWNPSVSADRLVRSAGRPIPLSEILIATC